MPIILSPRYVLGKGAYNGMVHFLDKPIALGVERSGFEMANIEEVVHFRHQFGQVIRSSVRL